MARATVLKRFELSPEAAEYIETRAGEQGISQTAFAEQLILADKTDYGGGAVDTSGIRKDGYKPCPACLGNGVPGCQRCDGQGIILVPRERSPSRSQVQPIPKPGKKA